MEKIKFLTKRHTQTKNNPFVYPYLPRFVLFLIRFARNNGNGASKTECPKNNWLSSGGRLSAVSAVSGDQYVCPYLFDFLTIKEVGRAACVCQAWRAGAEDEELWRELYARTQVSNERPIAQK